MESDKNDSSKKRTIHEDLKNLGGFKVAKILSENGQRKTITLVGEFDGAEGTGIVLLEKKPFQKDNINGFFDEEAVVTKDFVNDIYGNYFTIPTKAFQDVKTTIIHPATDKLVQKYTAQRGYLVSETAEMYRSVGLPHLLEEQHNLQVRTSSLRTSESLTGLFQWVYNVLEGKAEAERVVLTDLDEETGFLLAPDLKWDCSTRETLYLLAIARKRGIKSIRDLTAEHLPLLRNILEKSTELIQEKYGMAKTDLRIFLHYRPSFYHLHVHFTALQYDAPGIQAERAHLLESVISNLELVPDFYQRAALPLMVREQETLFTKLVQYGTLQAPSPPEQKVQDSEQKVECSPQGTEEPSLEKHEV